MVVVPWVGSTIVERVVEEELEVELATGVVVEVVVVVKVVVEVEPVVVLVPVVVLLVLVVDEITAPETWKNPLKLMASGGPASTIFRANDPPDVGVHTMLPDGPGADPMAAPWMTLAGVPVPR